MKPGDLIASRYTIETEIGRGGMGSVFVAKDQKFGNKVALKVAMAAGVTLDEFRERFAREARIGNRLGRSEGFVRALDWGEIDGTTLYLAMDLVEGARALDLGTGTLEQRLERLARAASLVATAHGLGVVHRDLKPQNFLVDSAGKIFLADFGLAKSKGESELSVSQITRTGMGMGTPSYMPPEQFSDARGADERADVYALGVMLFHALTGKLPYEGAATSVMQKQVRVQGGLDKPPRAAVVQKAVPAALDELCARALELDRDRRLADAREFAAALSLPKGHPNPPASRGEGVAPAPSSHVRKVAPPPAAPQRSNMKLWLIAGAVGFSLLLLFSCVVVGLIESSSHHGVPAHVTGRNGLMAIVEGTAPSPGMVPFAVYSNVPGETRPLTSGTTLPDGTYRCMVPGLVLQLAGAHIEFGVPPTHTETIR